MQPRTAKWFFPSALVLLAAASAQAATQTVTYNTLVGAQTLVTPFAVGDVLIADTLVTNATGALSQTTTFTVAPGVGSFSGEAAWEVSTAVGTLPRLTGVNVDIFDSLNVLVASDTFVGALGGFAHSSLAGPIAPGTYTMVATGTGVRDSVLDISLTFAPIPEPTTMLAASSAALLLTRRRSR
jgi:hypothetical protein